MDASKMFRTYIGTYAEEGEESIFLAHLNPASGEMKKVKGFRGGKKPSYMSIDLSSLLLFAVNEQEDFEGIAQGAVSSFRIHPADGILERISHIPSHGKLPVFCLFLSDERILFIANYTTGNIVSFFVDEKSNLGAPLDVVQHQGSGPDPERQASAHTHQLVLSPDRRFLFVVDLGLDEIRRYSLSDGRIIKNSDPVAFPTRPGWGPRHFVFHPFLQRAYLVHEIEPMVSVLSYDPASGKFEKLDSLPTIPEGFSKDNKCGAILLSPEGEHLYVSNRGHDSIAVFSVNQKNGKLNLIQNQSSKGSWPRDFALDPNGTTLVVANQRSNEVVVFSRDVKTGRIHPASFSLDIDQPVFVKII